MSVYIVAIYCFYIITVAVNFIVIIIILYISNIIVIIVIIIIVFALFFRFTLIAMLSLLLVYYQSLLKKLNLVRLVHWTTLHLVLYEIGNLYKKILCIDNGSSWNTYIYIYIYIYIYKILVTSLKCSIGRAKYINIGIKKGGKEEERLYG